MTILDLSAEQALVLLEERRGVRQRRDAEQGERAVVGRLERLEEQDLAVGVDRGVRPGVDERPVFVVVARAARRDDLVADADGHVLHVQGVEGLAHERGSFPRRPQVADNTTNDERRVQRHQMSQVDHGELVVEVFPGIGNDGEFQGRLGRRRRGLGAALPLERRARAHSHSVLRVHSFAGARVSLAFVTA